MVLRRYLGLSATIVLAGAIVGLLAATSPIAALGALMLCVATVGTLAIPAVRTWITHHHRRVRRVGFALMVVGPLVLPAIAIASGRYEGAEAWVLGAAVLLSCLGAAAVSLPATLAAAARDHGRIGEVARDRVDRPAASAVRIALESLATLGRGLGPLVRIFGPWALVNWLIFVAVGAYSEAVAEGVAHPVVVLLVLGAGVWVTLLTWPLLVVSWSRYLQTGRYPPHAFGLPDRAYWSVLWRGALLVGVLGVLAEMAASQAQGLSGLLGIDAETASGLLQTLAVVAGFVLLSSFALVLPARAQGDRLMSSALSAACLGRFNGGHFLGLILVLAPFLALRGLLQASAPDAPAGVVVGGALSLLMVVLNLGAVAAVTTYFTRLYGHCRAAAASARHAAPAWRPDVSPA